MSKKVSFVDGYSCLGWIKRIFTSCYSTSDVKAMAKKYEDHIASLEQTHASTLKECSDNLEKVTNEKDQCISDLNLKHNEAAGTAGRNAANREGTITGLKDEINTLKQEKKDLKQEHAAEVKKINDAHAKKLKNYCSSTANDILKKDKENKKKAEAKKANSGAGKSKGSKSGKAALTKEQVIDIYKRGNGGEDRGELEKEFKSNKTTIGRIITGKAYVKFTKDIVLEDKKESK